MRIMVGCPVRDRAWILPEYLDRIYSLDYNRKDIVLGFIINDSLDDTRKILLDFKAKHKDKYRDIRLVRVDLSLPPDTRSSNRDLIYRGLACLRNYLLKLALEEDADYLFSIDSDILVPHDSLKVLLDSDKDIISGQIWNDRSKKFPNIMIKNNKGTYVHYKNFPRDRIFPCDVTGAVYLIKRPVIQSVKYSYHVQGEDIGFCQDAASKGFTIWCNSYVKCDHIMDSTSI